MEEGILRYSRGMEVAMTASVFPHLSSDWICQMMLCGCFIWLASPLCSSSESDWFISGRAGRKAWNAGNCLALILFAFLYTVCVIFISILLLLPCTVFSTEWGAGWNTLALTNVGEDYQVELTISRVILHYYKPIPAMLWSFLLEFLCLAWLGTMMDTINALTGKTVGLYCALAFIFLDMMLYNTGLERFYRFSPITLAQLGNYNAGMAKYGVSLWSTILFFIGGILVFLPIRILIPEKKDL
ncbi:MAG: hypothetical protein LUF30_10845 [Lachnospiraceae bacterium]|nr:hypothetical protein [Lachnospiraceae bacterium]